METKSLVDFRDVRGSVKDTQSYFYNPKIWALNERKPPKPYVFTLNFRKYPGNIKYV